MGKRGCGFFLETIEDKITKIGHLEVFGVNLVCIFTFEIFIFSPAFEVCITILKYFLTLMVIFYFQLLQKVKLT
jgi:hypothetical protein